MKPDKGMLDDLTVFFKMIGPFYIVSSNSVFYCSTIYTYLQKGNHILYLYGICEYHRWIFYANCAGLADSQAHTLTFYNYEH